MREDAPRLALSVDAIGIGIEKDVIANSFADFAHDIDVFHRPFPGLDFES